MLPADGSYLKCSRPFRDAEPFSAMIEIIDIDITTQRPDKILRHGLSAQGGLISRFHAEFLLSSQLKTPSSDGAPSGLLQ